MVTKRKPKKHFGVSKSEDRKITPIDELPPIISRQKRDLYIVLNTAGEPMLRSPPQITRFAEHYESQGYLTARSRYPSYIDERGVSYYGTYLSAHIVWGEGDAFDSYGKKVVGVPLSLKERKLMISKLEGKMEGMKAVSTNPLLNRFCQKQAYKKCKIDTEGNVKEEDDERMRICRMCYSVALLTPGESGSAPHELGSRPALTRNTRLLSQNILEDIPRINPFKGGMAKEKKGMEPRYLHGHNWFRFSAEGDLVNETHLINLANIAIANPNITFTLWTKRPEIVWNVFGRMENADGVVGVNVPPTRFKRESWESEYLTFSAFQPALMKKPTNLKLIYSSPIMNIEAKLPFGFDKVFTVYTPEYVEDHSDPSDPKYVNINCQKHCIGCGLCYTTNNVTYIHENLKPGSSIVGKLPNETIDVIPIPESRLEKPVSYYNPSGNYMDIKDLSARQEAWWRGEGGIL